MKKTLTYYSIFFMFFMIVQRGSGFLTKIIMANTISVYEYGVLTLVALTIPGMFQLVTNLNFFQILSHSEEGKEYFRFTLIASMALTIASSILLYIFCNSFFGYMNLPPEQSGFFYLVIVFSMFSVALVVDIQGLFTGLKQYTLPSIFMALPSVMRLLFTAIIVLLGITSLELLLIAFTVANLIPLVTIALSHDARSELSRANSFKIPSKTIILFGVALFCISYFNLIGQYLIKLVISHNLGIIWQGYYDVSLTIAGILIFSLGTMKFLTIPEATNSDKNSIYRKGGLADINRVLFTFTILLSIILIIYSHFIVVTIFSVDFAVSADYLYILVIGEAFVFIQMMVAHINIAQSDQRSDYLRLTLIPLCILPLFFFLTEYLIVFFSGAGFGNGFIGAYVSYTILMILFTVITLFVSKDRAPIKTLLNGSERLVLSSILTIIVIYLIQPGPVPGILLLSGIFSVLVFLTGYLDKKIVIDLVIPHKKS